MITGAASHRPIPGAYQRWVIVPGVVLLAHAALFLALVASQGKPPRTEPTPAAAPIVMEIATIATASRPVQAIQQITTPPPPEPDQPLLDAPVKEIPKAPVKVAVREKPKQQKLPPKPPVVRQTKQVQEVAKREPEDVQVPAVLQTDNSSKQLDRTNRAAQVGAASSNPVQARLTWESEVLAKLQKEKRYPVYALRTKQQDTVVVKFSINREGELLSAEIVDSQGYSTLDKESIALLSRASPFPKPPSGAMQGDKLEIQVPIAFYITQKG